MGRFFFLKVSFFVLLTTRCGLGEKSSSGGEAPRIEQAFQKAASEYGVPVKILKTIGYTESLFSTRRPSALYTIAPKSEKETNLPSPQTAFGLDRSVLSLKDDETAADLETQVDVYAKYIKEKLKPFNLPPELKSTDDAVRWMWEVSKVHRSGSDAQKDVRLIFTREMIQVYNEGFELQISDTLGKLRLEKASEKISDTQLPSDLKKSFRLTTMRGEIRPAVWYSILPPSQVVKGNKPKGISVIHCPFSLSRCLELQRSTDPSLPQLGAHYVIPQSGDVVSEIIQLGLHEETVKSISALGAPQRTNDRIVVMLAGRSGDIVRGVRNPANPKWLSSDQLKQLHTVVTLVCEMLEDTYKVDGEMCRKVEARETVNFAEVSTHGVLFQASNLKRLQWGDIPDFDLSIFGPYLEEENPTLTELAFKFANTERIYSAGSDINFDLEFHQETRKVELERLVRCQGSDGLLAWEPLHTFQTKNDTKKQFSIKLYDSGANESGQQFIRARTFDDQGKLMGWGVSDVKLENFDKKLATVPTRYCN